MKGSAVQYWLILAALAAAFYGSFIFWRSNKEAVEAAIARTRAAESAAEANASPDPNAKLTEFVLTDENGAKFDSRSLQGKAWVGSFFFTNCPGSCWRLNQALADMQRATPGSPVQYVSITCDPENDKPEALLKYAQHFKADPARWKFLTGDFPTIHQIGNSFFKVSVEKQTHSDRAFVVDRNGQVRGRFRLTEPDQVELLKKLIAQVEEEPEKLERGATADKSEEQAASAPATDQPSAASAGE